ncbi:hypothetical protein GTP45_27445 [Pseudoduganella sp. FT55W]|uniref:Uncharacterized protein n=1 Tax=Duganella rivi TaxID=2666083 RepID=A0A7X4GXJ8_9BURK|nr:hypothetical protein [Duganella rivi]MYM70517.1 hypothetical protein [Duganella rivi]
MRDAGGRRPGHPDLPSIGARCRGGLQEAPAAADLVRDPGHRPASIGARCRGRLQRQAGRYLVRVMPAAAGAIAAAEQLVDQVFAGLDRDQATPARPEKPAGKSQGRATVPALSIRHRENRAAVDLLLILS